LEITLTIPSFNPTRRASAPAIRATLRLAAMTAVAATAVAAAATAAYAAGVAPDQAGRVRSSAAVATEPTYELFTVLNGGRNLATNGTGIAVAANPQTNDTRQMWERIVFHNIDTEPGFNRPYQFKNRFTGFCLQDVGGGFPVIERPCELAPKPNSAQLWHHHTERDREVGGHVYRFRFNRASGRVLSVAPHQRQRVDRGRKRGEAVHSAFR
jgi:hypothetical protein